ncbi:fimbrial tip adhesin FimD [Porphyromonas levii]|uniref:DUF4906 domain-containing protein n=1 Tax=Porphyromonas levii TaxID=28114 RepID=A0A4Y8WSY4_9PORP|nr:fimbrial protein [Porphyromonas levii]TFH96851.1 hypothetical protein E4P47_01645 [Porphyromonas levii]TFH97543.1 hypothetical protein E4P48_01095 [Porphyromonas levii]
MNNKFLYNNAVLHSVHKVILLIVVGVLILSCNRGNMPSHNSEGEISENFRAIDLDFKIVSSRSDIRALDMRPGKLGALRGVETEPGDYDQNSYGKDPLNENKIESLQIFIFDPSNGGKLVKSFNNDAIKRIAETAATEGKARVLIPKNELQEVEGKKLQIVMVANAKADLTSHVTKAVTTLEQLQAIVQDEESGFDTKDTSATMGIKPQEKFLMDGCIEVDAIRWEDKNIYSISKIMELRRAAAKVRLRIDYIKVVDHQNGAVTPYKVLDKEVRLVHYTSKGTMVKGKPYAVQSSEWKDTEYRKLEQRTFGDRTNTEGKYTFDTSFPFYAYENDWSKKKSDETYLVVRLKMCPESEADQSKAKYYYYYLPINFRKSMDGVSDDKLHRIERNYLYDVLTSIQQLGSLDEGNPVKLSSHIAIRPWNKADLIDGTILNAHFLVVREPNPIMPNTADREVDYVSDLPVEIVMKEVYYEYYDVDGKYYKVVFTSDKKITYTGEEGSTSQKKIEESLEDGKKTYDDAKVEATENHLENGKLKITHPIPVNYLPFHILFDVKQKVQNGDIPLQESVHVIQYPHRFVTGERRKTKGLGSEGSEPANADFRYHTAFGSLSEYPGKDGKTAQVNDVIYKVTTIVPLPGELIGDPTGLDGRTKCDVKSDQIISPEFVVASQYGMSQALPQYKNGYSSIPSENGVLGWGWNVYMDVAKGGRSNYYNDCSPYNTLSKQGGPQFTYKDYYDADSRCYRYFEGPYGTDGTYKEYYNAQWNENNRGSESQALPSKYESRDVKKTFQYKGRWRLPTSAEIEVVYKMQQDPNAVIKYLFYGVHYWTAREGYVFDFKLGKSLPIQQATPRTEKDMSMARPIFDTYKFSEHLHY